MFIFSRCLFFLDPDSPEKTVHCLGSRKFFRKRPEQQLRPVIAFPAQLYIEKYDKAPETAVKAAAAALSAPPQQQHQQQLAPLAQSTVQVPQQLLPPSPSTTPPPVATSTSNSHEDYRFASELFNNRYQISVSVFGVSRWKRIQTSPASNIDLTDGSGVCRLQFTDEAVARFANIREGDTIRVTGFEPCPKLSNMKTLSYALEYVDGSTVIEVLPSVLPMIDVNALKEFFDLTPIDQIKQQGNDKRISEYFFEFSFT